MKQNFFVELVLFASELLGKDKSILFPNKEAYWMVEHLLGKNNFLRDCHLSEPDKSAVYKELNRLIDERTVFHKPLAYVLGYVDFLGLKILCEPPILIPRPETEEWVANLIATLQPVASKPLKVLDLCTGSGCIALALANHFPSFTITGVDIDPLAIKLAEKNKLALNMTNIEFLLSDLFEAVKTFKFDIIVSNPPYISEEEDLSLEVTSWEALHALYAADSGLYFYKKIAESIPLFLSKLVIKEGVQVPSLALELCSNKSAKIKQLFDSSIFKKIEVQRDLFGRERSLFCYFS